MTGTEGASDVIPADDGADPAAQRVRGDAFDRAASVMYAVLLTVEALWIADVVTHGAVSRALEPRLTQLRRWARDRGAAWENERQVRLAGRHVVFEAMTIAQEGAE